MNRTATLYDDLDPFDRIDEDEADELDGFTITDGDKRMLGFAAEDHPMCDLGFGDDEGFCTNNRTRCYVLGCRFSNAQ